MAAAKNGGAVDVSHDPYLEPVAAAAAEPRDDHQGDFLTDNEQQNLARGLHQRHISLIALAGAIALLAGTRVLYGLALKGQAPAALLRTTSWGVPYVCVLIQTAFMFLAFMSLSNGALTVFYWFLNLTACGVLISWITILVNHQRLILAMKKQGLPLSSLPWHNSWTTFSTPVALFFCVVILFTAGFAVFTRGNWSSSSFISSYLDIGLVLTAFLLWKFIKKTKVVNLEEIPLREALAEVDRFPETPDPPRKGWKKWALSGESSTQRHAFRISVSSLHCHEYHNTQHSHPPTRFRCQRSEPPIDSSKFVGSVDSMKFGDIDQGEGFPPIQQLLSFPFLSSFFSILSF
ncbi:putative dicarboxylic amino acid permease protein [Lasiodiplodia theobromae]|nr:putative dicarboxylic amino acid permease protein [Lasiodiplodia theobromae]